MAKKKQVQKTSPDMGQIPHRDKLLHTAVWFVFVLVIAPFTGLLEACIVGLAIGIAKEVADKALGGHADIWDLMADIVGIIAAYMVGTAGGI